MKTICLENLPERFAAGTRELLPELGLEEVKNAAKAGIILRASYSEEEGLRVDRDISAATASAETVTVTLTYHTAADYFRALSFINDDSTVSEKASAVSICMMVDCSRNGVINLPSSKRMLRRLALMGYTAMMLYTEETYEIPKYPYFGYQRGRYTGEELDEIDAYADKFGIEVIPCIQALGHLAAALKWDAFSDIADTNDILLVGEPKTYEFIEETVATMAKHLRSRRIHIGMDEAHNLGLGRYLLKNGYRKPGELMKEHLAKVSAICLKYGYRAYMWSDMFFRAYFDTYYIEEGRLPDEAVASLPEGITPVLWDYYHKDPEVFQNMVECHKQFGVPFSYAGGAWRWLGFAPVNHWSLTTLANMLDICEKEGVDDRILTAWGDHGAECSPFAVLPSMLYFAERAYGHTEPDAAWLNRRGLAAMGISFDEMMLLDRPNQLTGCEDMGAAVNPCKYLLYNDVLQGLADSFMDPERVNADFRRIADELEPHAAHPEWGYLFDSLTKLCRVLEIRADLSVRIRRAYLAGDKAALRSIAGRDIPEILSRLDTFFRAFRTAWMRDNKPNGFEVQEIRLGGLERRLRSVAERLTDYADGRIDRIEEEETERLPFKHWEDIAERPPYTILQLWEDLASASVMK